MLNKLEHVGIAVKDLAVASQLYQSLLGVESYKQEEVTSENVITEFFKVGNTKIELLAASNEKSTILKFIEKKGEGIHHLAFEVDDIYVEMERLKKEGFILLNDEPKKGADNKLICFVHPKSSNGVLIELCQEIT
jgi:methylmalonyl-CoA/ethylmalonyl-CoA epimerase